MPRLSPTIRLFVSSTFSDFKAERDALQREVFPRLRELCQSKGLRFQPIDLRWGISEEAGRDNQTMRICLRELECCQRDRPKPNFLILLGDRYGWRPLPETIPVPLFEQLRAVVRPDLLEWRDDQPPSAKGCYRIDMNAVPPVAVLQPRGEQPKAVWHEQVEKPLLAALEQVPPPLAQALTKAGVSIGTAATHQEIVRGALAPDLPDDDRRHVRAFFRTIDGLPVTPPPERYLDTDNPQARPALEALKTEIEHRIGKRNVCHYRVPWRGDGIRTEDLGEFCAQALQRLSEVVEQQAAAFQQVAPDTLEEQAHLRFGEQRCRRFVGRIATLQRLADYLRQRPLQPLAALGPSGAGKSALMAKAAQAAREVHSNAEVIARYIGATRPSSDLIQLLRNLVSEIRRRYPATTTPSPGADADAHAQSGDADVPFDYPLLINAFHEALQRPTAGRPLLLFLDALDQLTASHHAHGLAWLPANLSPHVRLVVSAALPSATGAADPSKPAATADPRATLMAALDARLGAGQRFMLPPLTATDGAQMLANWLDDARRTLQPTQWAAILGTFQTEGSPLWLRTAAEEAVRLASWQDPPTYAPTTVGLFGQILDRLSRPAEHGGILVSRTLSYLACARHGLAEDEILDILSADPEVMADFRARSPKSPPVDRLPVAVWVRLYGDLGSYLVEREVDGIGLLSFYHIAFFETVAARYLPSSADAQAIHLRLADYFETQEAVGHRSVNELPWQLSRASQLGRLHTYVTNLQRILLVLENNEMDAVTYYRQLSSEYDIAADLLAAMRALPRGVSPHEESRMLYHTSALLQMIAGPKISLTALQIVLEYDEATFGSGHLYVGRDLSSLGLELTRAEREEEAGCSLERAAAIFRSLGASRRLDLALSLNNLGLNYAARGTPSKAQKCWQEAIQILQSPSDAEKDILATILRNTAAYESDLDAIPKLRYALKIVERSYGPGHPHTAGYMANLAQHLIDVRPIEAEKLARAALEIVKASFGQDDPRCIEPLVVIAMVCRRTSRCPEAEDLIRQAIEIENGSGNPRVKMVAYLKQQLQQVLLMAGKRP